MGATLERGFFSMYPSKKRECNSDEGIWLRRMCITASLLHFGLAILSLAIVGFVTMIINFIQCGSAYSCYLTLRECQIWVYLFFLFAQVLMSTLDLLGIGDDPMKQESSMQTLGHLISISLSVIMGYAVGHASYMFRKSGGLKGHNPGGKEPLLIEDQIAGYARDGKALAEGYANDYMDKQDKKDADDEEAYKRAHK